MSGTVATPVASIDRLGIHVPSYDEVLGYFIAQYQRIYGADAYLEADSQDLQMISVYALAISDANAMAAAAYAAFSPATAQGAGLSSVVKINGIARLVPTNSTVDLILVGQAGATIINGIVRDANAVNWLLPSRVVIPLAGQITVTAVAASPGAITLSGLGVNTANGSGTILTPTRGWQSASNPNPASSGDPLESDASLRGRQTVSTALPSLTVLDGIVGAIAQIPGVMRWAPYENDAGAPDPNGIPPYSLAMVVDGGDALAVATAIAVKKTPGTPTYGTTSEAVTDRYGVTNIINFFRPALIPITVSITVVPLAGFTTATEAAIAQAVADFINGLAIGGDVLLTKLYSPANLSGVVSATYNVIALAISRGNNAPAPADIVIAFNEAATCTTDNVTVIALVNP